MQIGDILGNIFSVPPDRFSNTECNQKVAGSVDAATGLGPVVDLFLGPPNLLPDRHLSLMTAGERGGTRAVTIPERDQQFSSFIIQMFSLIDIFRERVTEDNIAAGRYDTSVTFTFTDTTVFNWPFSVPGTEGWQFHPFILLAGTKVTFNVSVVKDPNNENIALLSVDVTLDGPTSLHGGFWGPVMDRISACPGIPKVGLGMRINRLTFTEAWDLSTNKPKEDYYEFTFKGNDYKAPMRIDSWASFHDRESCEVVELDPLKKLIFSIYGLRSDPMGEGEDRYPAYKMDMTGQMFDIMRWDRMRGTISRASVYYRQATGIERLGRSRALRLTLAIFNQWLEGLRGTNREIMVKAAPQIEHIESIRRGL